jgi:hypothetical protein
LKRDELKQDDPPSPLRSCDTPLPAASTFTFSGGCRSYNARALDSHGPERRPARHRISLASLSLSPCGPWESPSGSNDVLVPVCSPAWSTMGVWRAAGNRGSRGKSDDPHPLTVSTDDGERESSRRVSTVYDHSQQPATSSQRYRGRPSVHIDHIDRSHLSIRLTSPFFSLIVGRLYPLRHPPKDPFSNSLPKLDLLRAKRNDDPPTRRKRG